MYGRLIRESSVKRLPYEINEEDIKELIFMDKDTVSGELTIDLTDINADSYEHNGISIEVVGVLTTKDGINSEILHLSKDLDSPGTIGKRANYGFSFKEVVLPYESFKGVIAEVKYFLRATLKKNFMSSKIYQELPIKVIAISEAPLVNFSLDCELVNDIDCSITYKLDSSKFDLNDAITGVIKFNQVPHKMGYLVLQIVQREILLGN